MQTTIKKNGKKLQNQTANSLNGNISVREKIEARAHEIYRARGSQPGRELDDWLQAEQEIMIGRAWV
jgi:hypothetical protein